MSARAALTTALAALVLIALLSGALAYGERVQKGNLIVSLQGGIAPLKLPRDRPAPVALRLGGTIRSDDGSPVPRVKRIELAVGGRGLLSTHGLPVCPRARLRSADNSQAIERCGPALVGRGRLDAQVFVPHQAPFPIHARLLAFNGRTANGGAAVWVHAFAANPPISIVLPFLIRRRSGAFRTALVFVVPRSIGSLPRLTGFQISLSRHFRQGGRSRSYLSASCPVPKSLTAGFLSFARATYTFADGRTLRIEAVRSCRAR